MHKRWKPGEQLMLICVYIVSLCFFTKTARETAHTDLSDVTSKGTRAFGSNPLYMIVSDSSKSAEFLETRFGIMINHKGQRKQKSFLRGGGHNSNSLFKGPGSLNPQHSTANVPKGETKQVMK